jgi:hypothetical protein
MKKSHWITLIVLVILVAVYFVAREKQPVEKEKRFFKADSVQIARMEFITAEDTIIVVKKDGAFRLTYPLDWDVSEAQMKSFFEKILPITTSTTPMSEAPNMQTVYKVDAAQAVQIKLYSKTGNLLDHVYIGNGTNSTFDYGRREKQKQIYQFKLNITNYIRPDIYQWRSPNITNIKRVNIDKIDVVYTKNAYVLTVKPDTIYYQDKRESFAIPQYNRAQHKIINALENLMTYQYVDKDTQKYAAALQKPDCVVKVYLKDKKVRTLTMIREEFPLPNATPNGPQTTVNIVMMIDGNMKTLYNMTGDFINRFTRASGHFKVEYD